MKKGGPEVKSDGKGAKKTRLTYKEKLEYEKLEPEIEALEQEKATLEEEMNAGSDDYDLLHRKSERISELVRLIDEKMQRWMDLGQYV